ncbi:protein kinase domain-containing protein [Nocardiopsis listeri]|uniref:protein kinase domain-containing protein n=1 Tax=Nocardiopsis listeri TaxID=53440 RepID=UPI0008354F36|nr:protein kinase [Nocardiopsis listeri]
MAHPPSWLPKNVGGYRVTSRRLGSGGFGDVYLGVGDAGAQAAIKFLRPELIDSSEARWRFTREIDQLQKVSPFCVAPVLGADSDCPTPWIATEFIDGPTLRTAVLDEGPLQGAQLQRLAVDTAGALVAIHAAGVLHRDLKPENILLAPDGPRVIDFGIARALEPFAVIASGTIGTRGYMSPEQVTDDPLTPAVDIFAWGALLTFAATGKEAFPAHNQAAWIHQLLSGSPDLHDVREPFRSIIHECLSKDPADRPTAQDLQRRVTMMRVPDTRTLRYTEASPSTLVSPTRVVTDEDDFWDLWGEGDSFDEETTDPTPPGPEAPAHQLAHVLARTVTDLVRAGLSSVSTNLLAEAHVIHLEGVSLPENASFTKDLEWVALPSPHGGGLLVSVGPDEWFPADTHFAESTGPIPWGLWILAATSAKYPSRVVAGALREGEAEVARTVLDWGARHGDPICMMTLGISLFRAGRFRTAEGLLRAALDHRHAPEISFELGWLLMVTGRSDEAEQMLRRSADSGFSRALAFLGALHTGDGEMEEAERWLMQAIDSHDALGMLFWSWDLSEAGYVHAARKWYDRALSIDGVDVLIEAGDLYRSLDMRWMAEQHYRSAADQGSAVAKERLGDLDELMEGIKRSLADFRKGEEENEPYPAI